MLKVENGLALGYAADQPILVIQHAVDASTIRALLKAYKAQRGATALVDLVSEIVCVEPAQAEQGYYCSVDGASAPSERHIKYVHAEQEAERLAQKLPNRTVRIFRQVGTRKYESTLTAKMVRG